VNVVGAETVHQASHAAGAEEDSETYHQATSALAVILRLIAFVLV